ncbi:DUF6660 family protein [Mucilaginibacter hurinus]|uniref:DUF6660 family protein n=1 Tax=Mucilaginibacter hurinus TaxID=2201324 RepID=UPI003743B5C3
MRYVCFLFSVYFTLLAILPCHDSEDMVAAVTQVTVQKTHSPDSERGQETCPPFCTCTCCSTARHLSSAVVTGIYIRTINNDYPDFGISSIQEQPIKIWQPPQIS